MKKKLVIIGASSSSRLARMYFEMDSNYQVVGFSINREFIKEKTFEGLPLVALEEVSKIYPPNEYHAFVAVGYQQMNKLREKLYNECKALGYNLASYISSKCTYLSQYKPGDNCFILEDNTIQPYVKIGNNVVLWSGNHIGHDAIIEDNCYLTSHVVVSGFTIIKSNSFIGVNSTLRDGITVAKDTLIGAGSVVMKDTIENGVYLPAKTILYEKRSDEISI